jgi:hypothetical protein
MTGFDYSDPQCRDTTEGEEGERCEGTRLPDNQHCANHQGSDSKVQHSNVVDPPYSVWGM